MGSMSGSWNPMAMTQQLDVNKLVEWAFYTDKGAVIVTAVTSSAVFTPYIGLPFTALYALYLWGVA